jgi:lactoylglutathione lyase
MPQNSLVPELLVSNLENSLRFYRDILGFKVEYERPENRFAYLSFYGSELMLDEYLDRDGHSSSWAVEPLDYPKGRGINISIDCPSIVELTRHLKEADVALRKAVEECWYRDNDILHGQLNFLVQDPDAYLLRFVEKLGVKPISTV